MPFSEIAFDLEYILFDEILVDLIKEDHEDDRYKQLVGYHADLITYNEQLSIEGVDYLIKIIHQSTAIAYIGLKKPYLKHLIKVFALRVATKMSEHNAK